MMYIRTMVIEKPNSGETSSEMPISCAFVQFTALPSAPGSSEYAIPTPRIDPIRVCELDAGIPKYQVSKFHDIAEMSSAMTMEILCAMF